MGCVSYEIICWKIQTFTKKGRFRNCLGVARVCLHGNCLVSFSCFIIDCCAADYGIGPSRARRRLTSAYPRAKRCFYHFNSENFPPPPHILSVKKDMGIPPKYQNRLKDLTLYLHIYTWKLKNTPAFSSAYNSETPNQEIRNRPAKSRISRHLDWLSIKMFYF